MGGGSQIVKQPVLAHPFLENLEVTEEEVLAKEENSDLLGIVPGACAPQALHLLCLRSHHWPSGGQTFCLLVPSLPSQLHLCHDLPSHLIWNMKSETSKPTSEISLHVFLYARGLPWKFNSTPAGDPHA